MGYELKVVFNGNHIHAQHHGDDNLEISRELWTKIAEACEEHQCFNILGESFTNADISAKDSFKHVEIFHQLGLDERHRIAWVNHSEEAETSIEFTETVLKDQTPSHGGLFPNLYVAKRWLLGE
jgi:hypothetical protein